MRLGDTAATTRLTYFIALVGGLAQAAVIFPVSVLFPHVNNDFAAGIDAAQHIVGQRYFIADKWHWPLLNTTLLGGPSGTNIALTDSIPLLAMMAKLAGGLLPSGFHTVFLWLALSYALQPVAAVYAMRSAGERRLLPCVTAAAICGSMPALLWRSGHSALSGHFLILLAIGLALRVTSENDKKTFLKTGVLLVVSLLIHPYLMVMVAAVLVAAPLSLVFRGDRRALVAAAGVGTGLVITAIVALALGYGGARDPDGFGYFSMNLLSPIYPATSALFPAFRSVIDATGGQYEGYNYLGAGALLIATVAVLVLIPSGQLRAILRHGGLVLVCLILTLLALSNRIYIGHYLVLNLGAVPEKIQQFRSSGRFFWPVSYLIVIASIVTVARHHRTWLVGSMLVVAALLQIADATTLRLYVRSNMYAQTPWGIDATRMRPLLASHRYLTILPPYGCVSGGSYMSDFTQLLLLASEYVIPINTMYVARFVTPPDCGNAMGQTRLEPGELRVFDPPADSIILPESARLCRSLGPFAVCTTREDLISDLNAVSVPVLPTRATVQTEYKYPFLAIGWSEPAKGGVWSDGDSAVLAGTLDHPLHGRVRLTIWGQAFAPEAGGSQSISVRIDGHIVATWTMRDGIYTEEDVDFSDDMLDVGMVAIRFDIAHPTRPADRHINGDMRRLGLLLGAFRLGPSPSSE